jgi:exodeoxyribonuclease V alpha subunit
MTLYRIVTHIHPCVRILFVGDRHQLPSIGVGNILADIVVSKAIIVTELDVMKRSDASSGIPEYSNFVRDGIVPPELSIAGINFHETAFDNVAEVCTELYKYNKERSRILVATNKLVKSANLLCQQRINAGAEQLKYVDKEEQHHWDKLYLFDPILFTQNNYDLGIQNGTLGKLVNVTQDESNITHIGDVQVLGTEGEDGLIQLTPSVILNMQAGYAVTLHKAQGSQFPVAIVGLSAGSNLDRAWLYTAITRAEAEVHIVGPKWKLISAIKNISNANRRQTYLTELLKADREIDASSKCIANAIIATA